MKSPLPVVRAEVAAVALDGRLHALGEMEGHGPLNDEYNPATDEWHPEAPLVRPLDHLAVAEYGFCCFG
jgi:hypothetical protein